MNVTVSPSRTYVAICIGRSGGYYFIKFVLPEAHGLNNSNEASWYFLNRLDFTACIQGCFSFEDYSNLTEVKIMEGT